MRVHAPIFGYSYAIPYTTNNNVISSSDTFLYLPLGEAQSRRNELLSLWTGQGCNETTVYLLYYINTLEIYIRIGILSFFFAEEKAVVKQMFALCIQSVNKNNLHLLSAYSIYKHLPSSSASVARQPSANPLLIYIYLTYHQ